MSVKCFRVFPEALDPCFAFCTFSCSSLCNAYHHSPTSCCISVGIAPGVSSPTPHCFHSVLVTNWQHTPRCPSWFDLKWQLVSYSQSEVGLTGTTPWFFVKVYGFFYLDFWPGPQEPCQCLRLRICWPPGRSHPGFHVLG